LLRYYATMILLRCHHKCRKLPESSNEQLTSHLIQVSFLKMIVKSVDDNKFYLRTCINPFQKNKNKNITAQKYHIRIMINLAKVQFVKQ